MNLVGSIGQVEKRRERERGEREREKEKEREKGERGNDGHKGCKIQMKQLRCKVKGHSRRRW